MPESLSSTLDTVCATLAGYIEARADLAGLDVIVEKKGDLNQLVSTALAKLGVSVVVIVGEVVPAASEVSPAMGSARIVVEISETPTTNKSGRSCRAVAERVWLAGHGKPNGLPAIAGRVRPLLLEAGPNLRLMPSARQVVRHVTFTTEVLF